MKNCPHCARRSYGLLGATGLVLLLMTFFVAAPFAHADDYLFVGATQNISLSGSDLTLAAEYGEYDGYSYNLAGSFTDSTTWDDAEQGYYPFDNEFATSAPGSGDSVFVMGQPSGDLALLEGPTTTTEVGGNFDTIGGYYGIGYTGGNGFQLTNVGGTVANLSVSGPGTLTLSGLTVTGTTAISSIGGIGLLEYVPGQPLGTIGDLAVDGYAPSAMTVTGGSLSTPMLFLAAGTDLAPATRDGFPTTGSPDPVADAGSLTINGATLSGDVTQVTGVPSSSAVYGTTDGEPGGYYFGHAPGIDPYTLVPFNEESYSVAPVTLTNATLNAKTELDIVGVDPALYPLASGTTTLNAGGSTITAGAVVIATGAAGYGSGSASVAAALNLSGSSTLTANNTGDSPPSLVVGDTGDGTLTAFTGSTINSQQAVLGNAAESTGAVTIDGSTWNNASFLTVGNYGTGTLTAQDNGQVISTDVMYIGLNGGSTGTLAISSGATVTTNTTGIDGPNSIVLGTDADSTGTLTIDGAGSKLESTGDMQIGYSGTGTATITNGGALIVDGDIFRVGRNEGSTGTLTVTGDGSSVTASNGTIYIGYGGNGTVNVEDGATLSVMATDIGGQATGVGSLTIDGMGTQANLGDVTVGDAGSGMLTITGGATVNTGDITVGAQDADPTMQVDGANTQVIADGDMIVGDQGIGNFQMGDSAVFGVNTLTVGNGGTGDGQLNVFTGSKFTTADDTTVAAEEDSQGVIEVDGTGSALTVQGNLTVGGGGTGSLTVSDNATVTNQDATVGDEETSTGTVLLFDAGATWHTYGDLTIGENGTGEVTVEAGATMQVDGDLTLGHNEGSQGTLTVDGPTTTFTFGAGDVTIGSSGTGTMIVQNAAFVDLSGNAVTLGDQETGDGGLLVTDPGTILNTGALTVGGSGSGTLTVQNGGALSTGDATIGDQAVSNFNLALVTDPGSTWTTTGLTVGGSGVGTLEIENGGVVTVNNTELAIGDEAIGEGTVTLNGTGSTLRFTGKLEVGENGTGLFAVEGAASFTGNSVVVGDMPFSVGTLNVDGVGSKMEVQTDFNIGEQGAGSLNVTNSATLTSDVNTTLADMSGSSAAATVGTLANWSIGGTLTIGSQSTATLAVSGGANVSAANITIGDQGNGTGTVTVSGASAAGNPPTPSTMQFSATLTIARAGTATLNVNAGGQVKTFGSSPLGINVGVQRNSLGTVDISGTGSSLSANAIFIGENGTGYVTVEQGASLVAVNGTELGGETYGTGILTVNGNNAPAGMNTSIQAGALTVGYSGYGSLYVNGGAIATDTTLQIAQADGSTGNVSITGPNSAVQGTGALTVGQLGTGTVSMMGGASLTATSALIGGLPIDVPMPIAGNTLGGTGTITLNGQGTTMALSGDLTVGSFNVPNLGYGSGTLNILGGAQMTNQNAVVEGPIANAPAGSVTVSGTDADGNPSTWRTQGNLTIGQNGAGNVELDSGALVVVEDNLIMGQNIYPTYTVNFGQAYGTLYVTGQGTIFSQQGSVTTIGVAGVGSVNVVNGGLANFSSLNVTLGQNSPSPSTGNRGGTGFLTVGYQFENSIGTRVNLNSLIVGNGGTGYLQIYNGATVVSDSNSLIVANQYGSSGTVTLQGSGSTLTLNSGATVTVGMGGNGEFNVTNAAQFDAGNIVLGEADLLSTGTVNVTGTGAAGSATLLYDNSLIVGDDGTGNLNIAAGGEVAASGTGTGNVLVGNQPDAIGNIVAQGSTSYFMANSMVVGGPGAALSSGAGSFELITGASAEVLTTVTVGADGELDVAGTLIEVGGITVPAYNGGGLTIGSGSSLAAANQILVNPGGTLQGGGKLLTNQIYGDVLNNGGKVSLGDPLTLGIYGDYDQTSGELDLQFDGTAAGDFDQIDATGLIDITGGTIDLEFIDGYAPQAGDTFDFLDAPGGESVSGVTFEVNGLEPGFEYTTQIDPQTGAFELVALNNAIAIPEPSGAALVGSGLGLLALRRRRASRSGMVAA
jgi:T5SS/PEP-CTERM-associated repeat protein